MWRWMLVPEMNVFPTILGQLRRKIRPSPERRGMGESKLCDRVAFRPPTVRMHLPANIRCDRARSERTSGGPLPPAYDKNALAARKRLKPIPHPMPGNRERCLLAGWPRSARRAKPRPEPRDYLHEIPYL